MKSAQVKKQRQTCQAIIIGGRRLGNYCGRIVSGAYGDSNFCYAHLYLNNEGEYEKNKERAEALLEKKRHFTMQRKIDNTPTPPRIREVNDQSQDAIRALAGTVSAVTIQDPVPVCPLAP